MKTLSMLAALLTMLAVAAPLPAQEPVRPQPAKPAAKAEKPVGAGILADQIREGDVTVGTEYSLAVGARFHRIHTKLMAIQCATCHEGVKFPENIQFLRREEFPLAAYPGAVDRGNCMGCHRGEGSLATRFYGTAPK
jgi:hypothetical protein